jgi:K+-sensing histidine kinase KdpD
MTLLVQQDEPGQVEIVPEGRDDTHPAAGLVRQAAHDLRQPVAAILALATTAGAETTVPARVQRRLDQIVDEARWISKVIHDMLAQAEVTQRLTAVDVSGLVRDVVTSERLTYPGRIVLRQPDLQPRYVLAISAQLRRALANVLANATRAAGKDGCVQLTEQTENGAESVNIVDDGPGFGYVEAEYGIGLRATRQTLAECGGRMEAERLPSGHTLVRLLLPIMSRDRTAGDQ